MSTELSPEAFEAARLAYEDQKHGSSAPSDRLRAAITAYLAAISPPPFEPWHVAILPEEDGLEMFGVTLPGGLVFEVHAIDKDDALSEARAYWAKDPPYDNE